ncbi:MAG: transketolase [Christensenellales bacterium]
MDQKKVKELKKFAAQIRIEILKQIAGIGMGHVGGSMDMAELMAVLYGGEMNVDPKNTQNPDRDYLVLSKGHGGPCLYAALALKGFFPIEKLATLNKPGTMLPSHVDRTKTPGIDMTTGSLGQGGSPAYGIAFANRLDKRNNYTYVIFGDGELNEGQVWEYVQLAPHNKLKNLITIVDHNGLQIDGRTCEVSNIADGDYCGLFEKFGWYATECDGHNVEEIQKAITRCKASDKPGMVLIRTIKGKGWKAVENQGSCHHMAVTFDAVAQPIAELEAEVASLS